MQGTGEPRQRNGVRLPRFDCGNEGAQEGILALNPSEITGAVVLPLSVLVVVVVPGARHAEGLRTVEQLASGGGDVEAGVGILRRVVEVEVDAADRIDGILKAGEVDLYDVVDLNPEVGRNGPDQLACARAERGVDAVVRAVFADVLAEHRHHGVAGDRKNLNLVARRRHTPQLHDIAPLPGHLGCRSELRGVLPDPGVRSDHEHGEGRAALHCDLVVDMELVDPVDAPLQKDIAPTDQQKCDDHDEAQGDDDLAPDAPAATARPTGATSSGVNSSAPTASAPTAAAPPMPARRVNAGSESPKAGLVGHSARRFRASRAARGSAGLQLLAEGLQAARIGNPVASFADWLTGPVVRWTTVRHGDLRYQPTGHDPRHPRHAVNPRHRRHPRGHPRRQHPRHLHREQQHLRHTTATSLRHLL